MGKEVVLLSEVLEHESWWNFTDYIYQKDTYNSIFRGHSNYQPAGENFLPWELKSSFNRNHPKEFFHFNKMNEFHNLKNYTKLYRTEALKFDPNNVTFLEVLQFFQHYGIPTPLLDFTYDPLIALYFAVSGIPSHAKHEVKRKKENRHISIVEIDVIALKETLGLEGLHESEYDEILDNKGLELLLRRYEDAIEEDEMILDVLLTPNVEINPNLQLQKGVFIYFDSTSTLEQGVENLLNKNKVKFKHKSSKKEKVTSTLITYHNIPYSSIHFDSENDCINIYAYLMHKNKIGVNLFESDIQGLRHDLNNGDLIYSLGCMNDMFNCNCLENMRVRGIKF